MISQYELEIQESGKQSCSICGSEAFVEDPESGELICPNCGLVVRDRHYSLEQDWRAYSLTEDSQRSRAGYGLSNMIYDRGLSTTFTIQNNSYDRSMTPETRETMIRLKSLDNKAKVNEAWQRNLRIALSEMGRICNSLHLPKHINEKAAHIYRKALKEDLIRGRSIDGFVSAAIYAACRQSRVARSLGDVADASSLDEHTVKYHYRLLLTQLKLRPPVDKPAKFLSSLVSKLELSGVIEESSIKMLGEAHDRKLIMGKNPRGVAAAILYMVCQDQGVSITQAKVAKAANTSEVTMRKRFAEYEQLRQI